MTHAKEHPTKGLLTHVDGDLAGGSDRCSASGGAAWVKDARNWYHVWFT